MRIANLAFCLFLATHVADGLPGGHAADAPKLPPKAESAMVLRLVSVNDDYGEGRNPPSMVQYSGKGSFTNSDGNLALKDLKGLLRQTDEDKKIGRPAYLLIEVPKGISLDELVVDLNRLRKDTSPDTNAVVFIRVEGLEEFPPKKK
ncbi:MAG: hypothetical protein K8T89_14480 [Planctomycetes bacterium]|nr:hypothetical protein [Planctomycetota bacterium]